MFLQNLNFDQQRVFLKLANEMILSDNVLTAAEDKLIAEIRLQLPSNIEAAANFGPLETIFSTKKTRCSVLLEIIGIGFVDEEFNKLEQEYVFALGDRLQIDTSEISFLIKWVEKQFNLMKEINSMMGD